MKYNPFLLSVYSVIGVPVLGIFFGLIADSESSSGEQKLFTYITSSIALGLAGVAIINLVYIVFYRPADKRSRLLSLFLILASSILLYPLAKGVLFSNYDVTESTVYYGTNHLRTKFEYYPGNDTSRLIRSQRFWKNGKKDSIWVTYARDGSILKKQHFKESAEVKNPM